VFSEVLSWAYGLPYVRFSEVQCPGTSEKASFSEASCPMVTSEDIATLRPAGARAGRRDSE
jgi:hypothetical protein